MRERDYIFVSHHSLKDCHRINSGGVRRYAELYFCMQKKGGKVHWFQVSNGLDIIDITSLIRAVERPVFIVFHEEVLVQVILASLLGGTVVMFPRGDKMRHDSESGPFRRVLKKVVLCALYSRCDYFLFQSNAQRKQMSADYGINKPAGVVYNHINASWIKQLKENTQAFEDMDEVPSDTISIGFMGGDDPRKGITVALRAIDELRRKGYDAELIVAGEINTFASAFARSYVHVVGFLEDTSAFWPRIDVLWVPSTYESFPNVCLEAASLDIPFIVSDTAITRELFDECFISPRGPVPFAERTKSILKDDKVILEKIRLLRKRYDFDWSKEIIDKIISFNK